MKVLVTGGAGYIGSHAVKRLIDKKYDVIVIDNLSSSCEEAIDSRAKFYKIDIMDSNKLDKVFKENKIDIVMHFAAKISAPESLEYPLEYYSNNVSGTNVLLAVMKRHNVNNIVFSSTAAVYGLLDKGNEVIVETDPTVPINPYGQTKLAAEDMIRWANNAYGLNYIIFRYFNVAGNSKIGSEPHSQSAVIPKILNVAGGECNNFCIFGDDYNTKDGTCIRDYIHVEDLVEAHVLAAEKMYIKQHENGIYNLGNGKGFTVLEIFNKAALVTGLSIPMEIGPRRKGDPIISVASSQKARLKLGWKPKYKNIEEIIKSAWVNTNEENTARNPKPIEIKQYINATKKVHL